MTRWATLAAVILAAVLTGGGRAAGSLGPGSWAFQVSEPRYAYEVPFGRSANGGRLVVSAFGTQRVRDKVLVVGCIHGTECAGVAIARRVLRQGCPPTDADLWVVPNLNPDGHRLGTRLNARGVDLNRNFAAGWHPIGARGDPEYSGPQPFSEPESRAARRLVRLVNPAVTIWYHQGEGPLVRAWGPSVPAAQVYGRSAGLPFRRKRWPAGTAPHWQNTAFPGTSSFVVELPDGRLTRAQIRRHARAILALARHPRGNRAGMGGSVQGGR